MCWWNVARTQLPNVCGWLNWHLICSCIILGGYCFSKFKWLQLSYNGWPYLDIKRQYVFFFSFLEICLKEQIIPHKEANGTFASLQQLWATLLVALCLGVLLTRPAPRCGPCGSCPALGTSARALLFTTPKTHEQQPPGSLSAEWWNI